MQHANVAVLGRAPEAGAVLCDSHAEAAVTPEKQSRLDWWLVTAIVIGDMIASAACDLARWALRR